MTRASELVTNIKKLEKDLSDSMDELRTIQSKCKHTNKNHVGSEKDPGSGRTMHNYKCPDCEREFQL
ncbi:hypothetical protein CEW46_21555 [Bacillus cereus]|nr:hypothetical protein CEW46_21555 [Bacillus cereus]